MLFKMAHIALVFSLLSGFYFYSHPALARTAQEECDLHKGAELPGTCDVKGKCAHFVDNLGQEECKVCDTGGCQLSSCDECSEEEEPKEETKEEPITEQ